MGKVDFHSQKVLLPVPIKKAYSFLCDLENLHKLMPEQVINWQSTGDSCSFDIKGLAHISLEKAIGIPEQLVRIISSPENIVALEIKGNLEKQAENQTTVRIEITADLNPMLQLMVSGPLQNLVNIMADKLKTAQF